MAEVGLNELTSDAAEYQIVLETFFDKLVDAEKAEKAVIAENMADIQTALKSINAEINKATDYDSLVFNNRHDQN